MICTNRQLNHDFDDNQECVNWEDHVGLCFIAGAKICDMTPELKHYRDDIIQDLKVVLWKCSLPRDDGFGYDPSKGRFSTYAMRAMIRHHREIKDFYINYRGWRRAENQVKTVSFSGGNDYSGFDYLSDSDGVEDGCGIDQREILDDISDALPKVQAEAFRFMLETGHNPNSATRSGGCSKYAGQASIRTARKMIGQLRKIDPAMFSRMSDVVGGGASMSKHIITIGIPDADLSANSNAHYMAVHQLRKAQRKRVVEVIQILHPELYGAMWEAATIQYKFYFPVVRTRDDDNASSRMKSARDALSPTLYWKSGKRAGQVRALGAGVIVDDSRFKELPVVLDIDRVDPRVEIHIENTTTQKGTR